MANKRRKDEEREGIESISFGVGSILDTVELWDKLYQSENTSIRLVTLALENTDLVIKT